MGKNQKRNHIKNSIVFLTLITLGISYLSQPMAAKEKRRQNIKTQYKREFSQLQRYSRLFNAVHSDAKKALVKISSKDNLLSGDIFQDPDEGFIEEERGFRPPFPEYQNRNIGTGLVISSDGYLISSHKLVSRLRGINVSIDNKIYNAKLLGSDPQTNLSLLKIQGKDLKHFRFGNSKKLSPGDWVLSLRHQQDQIPLIIATVTGKQSSSLGDPFLYIQDPYGHPQDIGALINLEGHLVGIFPPNLQSQKGPSIAVPMSVISKIIRNLRDYGKVMRGWVGIKAEALSKIQAKQLNLKTNEGIFITSIIKNSPADLSGFKRGDLITKIGNIPISSATEFKQYIEQGTKGDMLKIEFIRNRKKTSKALRIEHAPNSRSFNTSHSDKLGLILQQNNAELLILSIEEGSPADLAGLKEKDILKSLQNTKLKTLAIYNETLQALQKGEDVLIQVSRNDTPIFSSLTVE